MNKRKYDNKGFPIPKVFYRKAIEKMSPKCLIKCGDCSNKFEIYYGEEDLEINGVLASKKEWKKILLPLLR